MKVIYRIGLAYRMGVLITAQGVARKQQGYKVTLWCCHGGLTQIAQLNRTAVSRTSPQQQMDESSVHVPRRILNWLRATLFLQVSN